MKAWIVGTGAALPERVVTNDELAGVLGIDASRIEAGSGIRERRWAARDESTSDLAARADVGREKQKIKVPPTNPREKDSPLPQPPERRPEPEEQDSASLAQELQRDTGVSGHSSGA